MRTGFALELLEEAFKSYPRVACTAPGRAGPSTGRECARVRVSCWWSPPIRSPRGLYLDWLRGWMSPAQAEREVRVATSDERDAHESLAAFRLTAEPSILVTVAMAYEGLDAPEVAVVAALTHIRSAALGSSR